MYRSFSDEPAAEHDMPTTQHGILTTPAMVALLIPGALDASIVQGHRVRRGRNNESIAASDEGSKVLDIGSGRCVDNEVLILSSGSGGLALVNHSKSSLKQNKTCSRTF